MTAPVQKDETNTVDAAGLAAGKLFHTTAAQFALRGHALQRSTRAGDGRVSYVVSRWNQSRTFTHWNDVLAFLAQVGGAA